MDTVDYKEKFEKLIQRIDNLIVNGWIDEKVGKAILKDFTLESEDEKIRKEIISFLKEGEPYYCPDTVKRQGWAAWLEQQGEQTTDKITERARTEKQRVLITETNGDAHIDWDCRNLQDVKLLLKYGLEYIDARLEKQGEQKLNEEVDNEYIDLGLPSGTLWKLTNEEGYYTFNEAVEKFCDNLPSKEQWEELENKCSWEWKDNGYDVTGPNGKNIFLPAAGYRYNTNEYGFVSTNGYYWSSKCVNNYNMWCMYFYDKFHSMRLDGRYYGQSVRLVK